MFHGRGRGGHPEMTNWLSQFHSYIAIENTFRLGVYLDGKALALSSVHKALVLIYNMTKENSLASYKLLGKLYLQIITFTSTQALPTNQGIIYASNYST
jgi:hypothetical protein